MTAIPLFRSTATPTRDMAPLAGTDTEYMRFLRLRRERQNDEPLVANRRPAIVQRPSENKNDR